MNISALSFYRVGLSIVLLSTSLLFAEWAFADSPHSYSGNQGQGLGNVSPGNPGNGPNAATAGKAGSPSVSGGGNAVGGITAPPVPNNASNANPSPSGAEAVGGLIESGVLYITDDQPSKHKKPKKKKDKKGNELENVVNTNDIKEVTEVEKAGQEVILKSDSNEKIKEASNNAVAATVSSNTIPVQIITNTIPATEQSKINEFPPKTLAELSQINDMIVLSENDSLSIPRIDSSAEGVEDITVVDLRKVLVSCYADSTNEERILNNASVREYQFCRKPYTYLLMLI